MKLPSADHAIIPAEVRGERAPELDAYEQLVARHGARLGQKVRDYLLAPANPRAQGKAAFFGQLASSLQSGKRFRPPFQTLPGQELLFPASKASSAPSTRFVLRSPGQRDAKPS